MSSIDNKLAGLPSYDPQGSAGSAPTPSAASGASAPAAAGATAAAPNAAALRQAAASGVATTGLDGVQAAPAPSAQQQVKATGTGTLLATPPPLPPTRGVINAQTAANYKAVSADITTAMSKGGSTQKFDPQAFMAQALQVNTSSQAGQAQLKNMAQTAVTGGVAAASSMSEAGMMTAFLTLNVKNAASGKELQSNLLDMATKARNSQIQMSIDERQHQADALKKAADKQKKFGPLMTILNVFITIVSVLAAPFSMGGSLALRAALVVATSVIGFVVGGAVGGKKSGKGFDLKAAIDGVGYAVSVLGLKGLVTKLFEFALKTLAKVSTKVGAQAATEGVAAGARGVGLAASEKVAALSTQLEKSALDSSKALLEKQAMTKALKEMNEAKEAVMKLAAKGGAKVGAAAGAPGSAAAAMGGKAADLAKQGFVSAANAMSTSSLHVAVEVVQQVQQIAQSVMDYEHKMGMLKAKEFEARAKMHNVFVDDAQARWEDLETSLQSISDAHNKAVDQALDMVNRHNRVAQKAAGNIAG